MFGRVQHPWEDLIVAVPLEDALVGRAIVKVLEEDACVGFVPSFRSYREDRLVIVVITFANPGVLFTFILEVGDLGRRT